MTQTAGYVIEDLSVGMDATFAKTITDEDIEKFAKVSGDNNPMHLDDAFAATTRFGGRIAHGMLSAGLISAVIGTRLPGPGAIYMSQSLRFRAPVKPGDFATAQVKVSTIDMKKKRVTLACSVTVGDTVVVDGEAMVLVPSRDKSS